MAAAASVPLAVSFIGLPADAYPPTGAGPKGRCTAYLFISHARQRKPATTRYTDLRHAATFGAECEAPGVYSVAVVLQMGARVAGR